MEAVIARSARRLIFAQSVDVLTFALFFLLIPASTHTERNPLIAAIYAFGGVAAVGLVKILVAGAVAYRSTRLELRRPTLIWFLMSAAIASGIVGAGFNLAALVDDLLL